MKFVEHLTWKCHICREERPDRFISVFRRRRDRRGVVVTENVRYCNDRVECIEAAPYFTHLRNGS